MTEKELKKLNRRQLLELLILQTERADGLEAKLQEAMAQLEEKNAAISNAGSIAEASLQLGGIFDTAQQTAEVYLENIRRVEAEAQARAQAIIAEAEAECALRKQEADAYWEEINTRLRRQGELIVELFGKETDAT